MNAYEAVYAALIPLGIPVCPETYDGTAAEYITYNHADDHGADFGDNLPSCNIVVLQVHLFLPYKVSGRRSNYLSWKPLIRDRLMCAGFTYPDVTVLTDPAANTAHLIFTTEFEETIPKGG